MGEARGDYTLTSDGVEQTRQLGATLGSLLAEGDIVLLEGALGAGKTAFTQGIGAGLGVREVINSPTFTILKEYAGRTPLYHFDLYRLDDPEELAALGFEEYFSADGVCVIEWAERGMIDGDPTDAIWGPAWLRIRIQASGGAHRILHCSAGGARGDALLAAFIAATREGVA